MDNMAIVTEGLTKKFKDLVAVDHVDIEVKKGEIFGLLGPNGAGKTTLIRMLCTLTYPTEGSASVASYDIVKEAGKVREHIGLVSEKMIMYDRLTAFENLKLFGKLCNIPKGTLQKRIDELLKLVHMEKWAKSQIGTFSTGMKQRINVIRALLNVPEILFMDEPTLGLDPQSTSEIREFIRNLNVKDKATIILTTHQMIEADMLCDRVGIIDKGKIVALDTPRNLKRIVAGADMTSVDVDIPNLTNEMVTTLKSLSGVVSVVREHETHLLIRARGEDAFDMIIDSIRQNGGKIASIKSLEPSLEDVYLHITGKEMRADVKGKVKSFQGDGHGPMGGRRSRVR
ncbi:MAG: ATP-binding cassette domain-containing protein [Methanobacteriota archaeon]|nr:MAG: ATP-binding cassette domain-containing protein [Euryarchaeota archaeon]